MENQNKSIIKAYLTKHSCTQLLLFPNSYIFKVAPDYIELSALLLLPSSALSYNSSNFDFSSSYD
ncbi:hypothetical protein ILYODFUR_015915, partial [Ilyodon furcidens]